MFVLLILLLFLSAQACEDNSPHCSKLTKYCMIKNYLGWMTKQCPKTCGKCPAGMGVIPIPKIMTAVQTLNKSRHRNQPVYKGRKIPQGVTIVGGNNNQKKRPKKTNQGLTYFEQHILLRHNEKRRLHNTSPLKWNKDAATKAKAWCRNLLKTNRFVHKPNNMYGENNWKSIGRKFDKTLAVTVTDSWYDEIDGYKWDVSEEERWEMSKTENVTGHFTQVAWKGSAEVGCGYAVRKNVTLVCCNYSPKGNRYGKYGANVPPIALGPGTSISDVGRNENSHAVAMQRQDEKIDEELSAQAGTENDNYSPAEACKDISTRCTRYIKYCSTSYDNTWLDINCKKSCKTCDRKERAEKERDEIEEINNSNHEIKTHTNIESSESFTASVLAAHNEKRRLHSVGTLTWNAKAAEHAQSYCETLGQGGEFKSSTGHNFGENLYKSGSSVKGDLGSFVVGRWYNRGAEVYDWKKGGYQSYTGQMTQIIWKGTRSVGCGFSVVGRVNFVCCNYHPKGNYLGHFHENVFPPKTIKH